jgi:hypothetical protein
LADANAEVVLACFEDFLKRAQIAFFKQLIEVQGLRVGAVSGGEKSEEERQGEAGQESSNLLHIHE